MATSSVEQLVIEDLPSDPGRNPHDERSRRNVACDDGAGCDERLLPYLDAWCEDCAAPNAAGATQGRTRRRGVGAVAGHRVVICRNHAGPDEHVVLDDRERGQVNIRLHAHACADLHVVIDDAAATDYRACADRCSLPHERLVADDRMRCKMRTGKDDGSGADAHTRCNPERQDLSMSRGVGRQPGALAQHRVIADRAVITNHCTCMYDDMGTKGDLLSHLHTVT